MVFSHLVWMRGEFSPNLDKAGGFVLTQIQSAGARIEAPQGVELKDYYSAEEFEREVLVPERNAVICEYIASFLESMGSKSKSIVFCVSQNHAPRRCQGAE